ncbi:hypothetical protein OTB20_03625 [Streptomyces sp. H27-H1]|uniref:hypothetical protein n=1 Tax=Streptomyces sp. H27-H1 TaxID=2996461 RepID=UPI00226F5266|nr:hypothetical protein [Streptomyces sp. H27-H1]MCY0925311.1 hypothetical protein [Streptomyces sp. H27-H1]
MILGTVLILVASLATVVLLILAPSAPARRNPFPGRRRPATHRRPTAHRSAKVPRQHGIQHHTR